MSVESAEEVLARRRYTRVTKVYPFRRSDPSASRLSSAVDLCGAHSVDVTECALPSFARSKMLKPIRSIFSIQVHVHVRYSVLAFVTGLCLRDARPPAAYAAQTANPSWANLMANLHAAASPSWTANVVVHRRRRSTHHRTATGVHKRRPHKAPEDPSLHSGLSGQRQRHGRAGARWRCTVCRIRFAIADSGKSASNECGTSGPSDLYSGPQNVTAHACVHMTHATIMQHAK